MNYLTKSVYFFNGQIAKESECIIVNYLTQSIFLNNCSMTQCTFIQHGKEDNTKCHIN